MAQHGHDRNADTTGGGGGGAGGGPTRQPATPLAGHANSLKGPLSGSLQAGPAAGMSTSGAAIAAVLHLSTACWQA
jgi:hypothetical protein